MPPTVQIFNFLDINKYKIIIQTNRERFYHKTGMYQVRTKLIYIKFYARDTHSNIVGVNVPC